MAVLAAACVCLCLCLGFRLDWIGLFDGSDDDGSLFVIQTDRSIHSIHN